MTAERWARLKEIFAQALEKDSEERDGFVMQALEGDAELLGEARRLLANHDEAESFLSQPALGGSAPRAEAPLLFGPEDVVAGRFRIVRFIARGGMGEVYEAEDLTLASRVALKTIQPHITGESALELFKQEILSARRVTHSNVCRIYDIAEHLSEDGGAPVMLLTMELLEGPTLSRYLREHGPIPAHEALPLIEQICSGLQAAHDAGIIHRDFKSGNVILTRGPNGLRPVITDFGLARAAGSAPERHPRGTPGYMAPEQLEGSVATPATDVYALGVVIGRMTGEKKPARWKRVIDRCVEPEPSRRYQKPAAVAAAFRGSSTLWHRGLMAAAGVLAIFVMWGLSRSSGVPQMADRQAWNELVFAHGSISWDGRYLTFTSQESGDLAVRDLRSGTTRLLTHKPGGWSDSRARAGNAIISPDNKQVVYVWFDRQNELRMVPLTGDDAPKTLSPSKPDGSTIRPLAWAPDSKSVLVADGLQLSWLSVGDGSVRVLKNLEIAPVRATLSPDGRYIAYDGPSDASDKDSKLDIFVLAADGSQEAVAVKNAGNDYGPMWCSNGSILFRSDRTGSLSLWTVRINGGKPTGPEELVKANFGGEFTSLGTTRDGNYFYSTRGIRNNVFVAEMNTEMLAVKPPVLAAQQFVNSNFSAAWSPDGRMLAYVSQRGVFDGPPALVLQSWPDGKLNVIPLEIYLYTDTPAVWFPDGRSVLVAAQDPSSKDGVRSNGLYRVDVESGAVQLVRRPAVAYFDFLLGGKAFLYGMNDPVTKQWGGLINRFDIAADKLTTVRRTGVRDLLFTSLAVSPDGKQVAMILRNDTTHENSVEVMPVDGGPSRELYRGTAGGFSERGGIAWSPDQRYLLFVRDMPNPRQPLDISMWRISVAGGEIENTGITVHGAADDSALAFPSIHPDGRHIAYTRREPFSEVRVMENFLSK